MKSIFQNIYKTKIVPNITSSKLIWKKAKAKSATVKRAQLNLCTVCRCDIKVKGLDRILNALHRLKEDNLCNNIYFHIIGGGNDYEKLLFEIKRLDLTDIVLTYGNKKNPLPYLLNMDGFVLASRYEGKPVSVTEAQILGLPCIITNYESASSQVKHDYDGWIMENSSEDVYNTIKKIICDPSCLRRWKANVIKETFGNEDEIDSFYKLIE